MYLRKFELFWARLFEEESVDMLSGAGVLGPTYIFLHSRKSGFLLSITLNPKL